MNFSTIALKAMKARDPFFAVLLALSLITVSFPVSVFADEAEAGTESEATEPAAEAADEEIMSEETVSDPVDVIEEMTALILSEPVVEAPAEEVVETPSFSVEMEVAVEESQDSEETEETEAPACVLVSDTQTLEGGEAASLVSSISSYWTAVIADASWIWGEDPVEGQEATKSETFTRTFFLDALPSGGFLEIAVDDGYTVALNGNEIGADTGLSQTNFTTEGQDSYLVDSSDFVIGENVLTIESTNIAWEEGGENPGGVLFKLSIFGAPCVSAPDNGDDGDNNGGSHRHHGGQRRSSSNGGEVLGASTDCAPLVTSYMRLGWQNDPAEVIKVQEFLNKEMGSDIPLTGFFGPMTAWQVGAFQAKYADEVLKPWYGTPGAPVVAAPSDATGFLYKTTKWKINNLVCPGSETFPIVP